MKSMIQIFMLFVVFGSILSAKNIPEDMLKSLPTKIEYFTSSYTKVYDEPALGASIAYDRNSLLGRTAATIYAYDLGVDILNDTVIKQAFDMGVKDIKGMHSNIQLIKKGEKIVESTNNKIYYAMYKLNMRDSHKESYSYIFVSGNKDYIYKVRITSEEKNMQDDMIKFSNKIIELLLKSE